MFARVSTVFAIKDMALTIPKKRSCRRAGASS
jgi:hypothetical protein